MAFDGFITKAIITELKTELIGAKVNKVFQPTKSELILSLYNMGNNYYLNICTDPNLCRICLTETTKPNPQNAYQFCMLLRKYLTGGKIVNISSYDLERTVEIQFECYNDLNDLVVRKLFVEIMSRQSNIILTNENNIIIDTLKHFDNRTRELLPAHEYKFAPISKISFINQTLESFVSTINEKSAEKQKLSQILMNTFIGFSKPFITEILNKYNIDDKDFSNTDLENIFLYIKNILNNLGTNKVVCKETSKKDYTIILADNNCKNNENNEKNLGINSFIDNFYFTKEQSLDFISSRNNLLRIISSALKKVSKKLENIDTKLKECENMDTYKLYGELLTANLYQLNNDENLKEIELENYYNNYKKIKIPLDKTISVQKNVEKYFKKYNKLKNALEIVSEQKVEAEKELDYIESIVFSLENAKNIQDIKEIYEEISQNIVIKKEVSKNQQNINNKKKINDEIQFETTVIDDFTIYIGKNNMQNDYISLKLADKNDIWFHTQKIHGSHILLRNPENLDISDIPENVLFNCAKLAKENSKANSSLNVSVDYCLAKYVKKVSGAKPGMVIYTNFKTIIVK